MRPSTPAVLRPALISVTRRTLTRALLRDRSISFCRLIELRQRHNDVAAAIFSIIGVTYAVLLAFVAMLALEGFNRAKVASYAEAALIGNVYHLSAGFPEPERSSIGNQVMGYARHVVTVEWPEQAEGRTVDQGSVYLEGLNKMVLGIRPSDQTDREVHSLLLQAIERYGTHGRRGCLPHSPRFRTSSGSW